MQRRIFCAGCVGHSARQVGNCIVNVWWNRTHGYNAAERQNSATLGRGLKPTRDFPANPWRSLALAPVTSA